MLPVLAFLNLGATEIALLLVAFLVLFGADRVPQLMRSLGRAKAEFERAQRQAQSMLKTDDERQLEEQLAFERLREQQMRAQSADPEREALARAAEEMGIQSAGLDKDGLKRALAQKLEGKGSENAATAQQ